MSCDNKCGGCKKDQTDNTDEIEIDTPDEQDSFYGQDLKFESVLRSLRENINHLLLKTLPDETTIRQLEEVADRVEASICDEWDKRQ